MKFKKIIKRTFVMSVALVLTSNIIAQATLTQAELLIKKPGNDAEKIILKIDKKTESQIIRFVSEKSLPVVIEASLDDQESKKFYSVKITANEDVYFNFKQNIKFENAIHSKCKFLMPGFWYRYNLRSPKEAPSFHTSDSWMVREDRLSAPLTGIFDETNGKYVSVLRTDKIKEDALTSHKEGEVILSGNSDLGFTGFENINGNACFAIGYPYREAPKSYIRKLTLAPPITAFCYLRNGESKELNWLIESGESDDFDGFVAQTWNHAYDFFKPDTVSLEYSLDFFKKTLTNFYSESYNETGDLNYFSGVHLRTDDCKINGDAEIGFVGRVLLNAYFALMYAEENGEARLKGIANSVLDSYLENGFTDSGFFREYVEYSKKKDRDVYSIRRQSEGIYAILNYLHYENSKGRKHPEWENRIKVLLDNFLKLQNEDGSFPRKFTDNFALLDSTGGSTPSATVPLVMASKYFKEKKYLKSAQKTGEFLEKELISKSDYFSSTLDANCEDKEASLYASTAMYYLALASKGKAHDHYVNQSKKAAYFALSWYYLWDVPFAQGQMLGDIGLKSRGWGNVSVENNHIDVFIFEFADVLNYLAKETSEARFSQFAKVIETSMLQLLPYSGHMCGIGKEGYYPEVVQHTNWDYGHNGKGFYNTIFAPGWTVASLWELLTPGNAEDFLKK
jgi:hypothetical protein